MSVFCKIGEICVWIKSISWVRLLDMFSVFRVIEVSRVSLGVGFCGVVFISRIDVIYRVEGGVCIVVWVIRNSRGGFFWIVVIYGIYVICYFIIRGGCGCIVSIVVLS